MTITQFKDSDMIPPVLSTGIGRVTLRTLVFIRWIAVGGQMAALLVAHFALGYALPMVPAIVVIGSSVVLNLLAQSPRGLRPTLRGRDVALYLAFDIIQLSCLLHLTGGLTNPFTMMLLAPLTVAATLLNWRYVAGLTFLALLGLTAMSAWRFPLPWTAESFPQDYVYGLWISMALSAVFLAIYVYHVSHEAQKISNALTASQAALDREQRLSTSGALAAAAAHELGSPLSTIAITVREMERDLPPGSGLREDIALLNSQVARCRDILATFSRQPQQLTVTDPGLFGRLPLSVLVQLAAEPHRAERIDFVIAPEAHCRGREPRISNRPEITHGLGNLLQNGFQFAHQKLQASLFWNDAIVRLIVSDDGPGFPVHVLSRMGEPYLSVQHGKSPDGGGHMGLGIFIAQVLLERTGANLSFGNNDSAQRHATIVIEWPRSAEIFEPIVFPMQASA
ncbi:MAG: ActS/PrrB/RegB family redox-sensitive histidine kinase [Alphaproteobacteria bacterium]|nr:MAG: ActS/PrrB/RegB family redox-sensitive histidine kinase [Alphaproteobacteria bacterium]